MATAGLGLEVKGWARIAKCLRRDERGVQTVLGSSGSFEPVFLPSGRAVYQLVDNEAGVGARP